jgi:predicted RNase H-like HicB family nuclease
MKKIVAIIEKGEDGSYGIHSPKLKNFFFGEGETVVEAKEDYLNSYQEMIESYVNWGKPIPEELQNIEFVYQYDISAFYDAHPYLNVSKLAEHIHLNKSLMRQYKRGQYISERQVLRIQEGIRSIGRELAGITLIK